MVSTWLLREIEDAWSRDPTMSLSSTSNIKAQINHNLGPKAPTYFECLHSFVTGKISRTEFDDTLKPILDAPNLSESFFIPYVFVAYYLSSSIAQCPDNISVRRKKS